MSEQDKTEAEVKESTYVCDWNGSSWTFKRHDGEVIKTRSDLLNELGTLLARAKKAEAALESAQKMSDHWEEKAAERQKQINEWKARVEEAEAEIDEWKTCAEKAETQWEEWRALFEKAEAQLDEFKRRAGNAEFELKRQKDLINPVDWERVRIDAAIAAMQALLPDIREFPYSPEWVVQHAAALVAELKKEVAK